MELDHFFICTRKGAAEAELLENFSLSEGSRNFHPGQGTANRRFFFQNAMMELLWLDNPSEAQSDITAPTGLFERCSLSDERISPFGICFRPDNSTENSIPFPAWNYNPAYLPPNLSIAVGKAPLTEPMWFFLPFMKRPDLDVRKEPADHETGFREVTAVTVTIKNINKLSAPATTADNLENFSIQSGNAHLLELEFDGKMQGKCHDFRPHLPLVFRW